MSKKEKRPKYIIQVHQNWRYGPRARFWEIQEWREHKGHPNGGWWTKVTGGLAYTKWGMTRAINKRLKKLEFGYQTNHFNLDGSVFKGMK
jgi:hypothetical protein